MNTNTTTDMQFEFEDTCDKTLQDLTLKYSNEARHNNYINFWQKYFPEATKYIDEENNRYYEKIKQNPDYPTQSYKNYELTKAHETILSWNTTRILLYVIEIRTRYNHYNSKYDEHLYEFCYVFLKNTYSEDLEMVLSIMKSHVFNESSTLHNRITNYIKIYNEYKILKGIFIGTASISIERFKNSYWSLRNPSLKIA